MLTLLLRIECGRWRSGTIWVRFCLPVIPRNICRPIHLPIADAVSRASLSSVHNLLASGSSLCSKNGRVIALVCALSGFPSNLPLAENWQRLETFSVVGSSATSCFLSVHNHLAHTLSLVTHIIYTDWEGCLLECLTEEGWCGFDC